MYPSVSQTNILASLRSFLVAVLPTAGPDGLPLDVIVAQQNRIPAPRGSSYVIMTLLRMDRIETNVDSFSDAVFTGSISGATMTIDEADPRFSGLIGPGSVMFGVGLASNTIVSAVLTGAGGIGTYAVAPAQNISSRTLAAGTQQIQQALKCTIQLDFHSADQSAGDLANIVSTLFRDGYATGQFTNQSPNYGVVPLLADDAKQVPFLNDSQQVETRWVCEVLLQANIILTVPQQFYDAAAVDLINVDAAYPNGGNLMGILLVPALNGVKIGETIAVLSVIGGIGSYTYSFTNAPAGLEIVGNQIVVSGVLEVGDIDIEVLANNGAGSLFTLSAVLPVLSVSESPAIPLSQVFQGETVLNLASAPNGSWLTYTMESNPNDYFFLDGSAVIIAEVPPIGDASVSIRSSTNEITDYTFEIESVLDVWQPGQRPFSNSSPINTPLPDNAILAPLFWPGPYTGGLYWINAKFLFDRPAGNAPLATVAVPASWGWPAGPYQRRMTAGFNNFGGDTDHEAMSIIGNDCQSYWKFTRVDDTHATASAGAPSDLRTGTGFGTLSPFKGAGVLAGGQSCMAGALLKEEFAAGEINHVLALCMYFRNISPGLYAPAINSDAGDPAGFASYGQLLAIPKSVSEPSGLSLYGQKIFRALQNYGAIVADKGINQFYLAYNYQTYPASTTWNEADRTLLKADVLILIPMLQKVGYVLDGLYIAMGTYLTCAPQKELLAYNGYAMHITRDSDAAELDISFGAAPQSELDTDAIIAFAAGTVARVATYKTQFGVIDFTSAGAAAPAIYSTGALKTVGGKPALSFDGINNYMKAVGSSAAYPNGNIYIAAVVQIPDLLANYGVFGSASADGLELRIDATTGLVRLLKNGSTTIGISNYAVPVNVPVLIGATYRADGSYSISMNAVKVVQGTGALIPVTAGDIQVGAGGPAGTELFKGLISAWTVSSNISPDISQQAYPFEHYLSDYFGATGTIAFNATTLDPAHKNASISLTGGHNLTAISGASGYVSVFSTTSKSAGLPYCEIVCTDAVGVEAFGLGNNSVSTSSAVGATIDGIGYYNNGAVKINGATVATLATWTDGNTILFQADFTHSKVWFGVVVGSTVLWNNDILANQNPATNTGGISIASLNAGPYFVILSPAAFHSSLSINFNGSAYLNQTLVPSVATRW